MPKRPAKAHGAAALAAVAATFAEAAVPVEAAAPAWLTALGEPEAPWSSPKDACR